MLRNLLFFSPQKLQILTASLQSFFPVNQKVKDEICFEISDDGNGLTEEQIAALKERLARKNRDEKEGVGLWNVNQRLVNYYGEQSSLQFGGSIWKGLCVSFVIDGKERL